MDSKPTVPAAPSLRWKGREKNQPTAAWLEAPEPQAIRIQALLQDSRPLTWSTS